MSKNPPLTLGVIAAKFNSKEDRDQWKLEHPNEPLMFVRDQKEHELWIALMDRIRKEMLDEERALGMALKEKD